MTPAEVAHRNWDAVDVVLVTGDAYVDHPSFAAALLGRVMEAEGYRVAVLSQPDWHSAEPWRQFGHPRLCFAVSAGNMDSMINHYTAARKVRNDDAYSPGGQIGRRPDRATLAYCQRAREAFKGVPVIAGGVEASLRRLAHYDYWSDKVRRSILLDAKADLLVYGMGERPLVEILRRLAAGQPIREIRDVRGTVYRLGASERLPSLSATEDRPENEPASLSDSSPAPDRQLGNPATAEPDGPDDDAVILPRYEEVAADKQAFVEMTRLIHRETQPYAGRRLVQYHGREAVVVNPPSPPLDEAGMDRIYGLPFTRRPHPSYGRQKIPAFEVIRNSVTIMRGCFGGCAFCSLSMHQGRIIQSRSRQSVVDEIRHMADDPDFTGTVSDLGGPSANMYRMRGTRPEACAACRRESCVHPDVCKLLSTDHRPLIELMRACREVPGVKQVLVASGVRMDLARLSPEYIGELAGHHTGGLLKVAPEHVDAGVLRLMKKPPIEDFEAFAKEFRRAAGSAGKRLHLVPYFMAGHPGSDLAAMIRVAQFLQRTGLRPEKVQDFIPAPMDLATCMYYTGIDPATGRTVHVPKGARERRLQRALLQYWMPENYDDVRRALEQAGRFDLIGPGADCLIPARRPRAAAKGRTGRSRRPQQPGKNAPVGYRPHRRTARRRKE